jgi:flagellar motor switch protein FliM
MGDILSQTEIDALLRALNAGQEEVIHHEEEDVKKVKDYNFKRPSKFSKDHLRTLEVIFENYSRFVSSFLSAYLRTATTISVANAEQVTYNEFNNSLVNPILLGVINFSPLKGSIVLEISTNLAFAMIDRILCGHGFFVKIVRDFSEIELILLDRIYKKLTEYLIEPWQNVLTLNAKLERIETNSQFSQIISPNEMIALVTLSVKIGETQGFFNFCMPHLVIEPIIQRLNTRYWFSKSDSEEKENYRDLLEDSLNAADITITAEIGRAAILTADFVSLGPGDIIPLDSYADQDLDIYVGNLLKFKGRPGINKGKNAVQITSVLAKEE